MDEVVIVIAWDLLRRRCTICAYAHISWDLLRRRCTITCVFIPCPRPMILQKNGLSMGDFKTQKDAGGRGEWERAHKLKSL